MSRFVHSAHLVALGVALAVSPAAFAQFTVFTANGFDTGYSATNLRGQNNWQAVPTNSAAATVQATTVNTPANAVQITGNLLSSNPTFSGGNFWYQSYTTSTGYQPVASGTPYVQASFQGRRTTTGTIFNDIPFAGIYLEGFTAGGVQQSLTPVMLNRNGGVTVFTDVNTGGANNSVSTNDNLFSVLNWHQLTVDLNFTAQTFRVFNGGTLLSFTQDGEGSPISPITDVPFRNSFGNTTQLAELGLIAFYGTDLSGNPVRPQNNFFVDDFAVTATSSPYSPVPEPGSILGLAAVGAAAGAGIRRWRQRATSSSPLPAASGS